MSKGPPKRVSLRGSALFKITSPARLAEVLLIDPGLLEHLVRLGDDNYTPWMSDGRLIEEPKPQLKQIHARVAKLLQQIETPDYLHSGVRKRSYITNAVSHSVEGGATKLDIKKFFPSARGAAIYHFFHDVLEYPGDVAKRMTTLLTYKGHLPTGGNASCILSFWAYKRMFDAIAELAAANGCTFTLYVDDMTISGRLVCRSLQHAAKKIVGQHRLIAHKSKLFSQMQSRVVTGVAMTQLGAKLPNRRAQRIACLLHSAERETDLARKLETLTRLVGMVSEAAEIDYLWKRRKDAVVQGRRGIVAMMARRFVDLNATST